MDALLTLIKRCSASELCEDPPSVLLKDSLPNKHTWFLHHITTHIAVHIGNLVVWKKLNGLAIEGY